MKVLIFVAFILFFQNLIFADQKCKHSFWIRNNNGINDHDHFINKSSLSYNRASTYYNEILDVKFYALGSQDFSVILSKTVSPIFFNEKVFQTGKIFIS